MAQRVLVTAGASGIGKEIARAFAEIGAKVCVCDINAKALDTAAKYISGLKTVVCDVSKRDDIERMVAAAVEADHQPVADERIAAHALDRDQVAHAIGMRRRRQGKRRQQGERAANRVLHRGHAQNGAQELKKRPSQPWIWASSM